MKFLKGIFKSLKNILKSNKQHEKEVKAVSDVIVPCHETINGSMYHAEDCKCQVEFLYGIDFAPGKDISHTHELKVSES